MKNNISIFISYSWNDRTFVDGFDEKLQKHGYKIERDIRDAEYAKSIKEFMKRIRRADYSIIILSDSFLKSENCMREILEFIKDDDYKNRIIPVILNSVKDIWGSSNGAIEITVDDLIQIDGADKIIAYINDYGASINEIYYRDNNIIQINYQTEDRETNATYILS